jgi:putative serine protease PepD
MNDHASFTWKCPECGRHVPRRMDHCRCGYLVPDETEQTVPVDPEMRRWTAWLVVVCLAGGLAGIAYQRGRTPTMTAGATPMREAVGQTAGASANVATAARDTATAPEPQWPSNVPFVTSEGAEPAGEPGASTATGLSAPAEPAGNARSLEEVAASALPSVVLVETPGSRGAGFFISSDTALTNAHVIEGNSYVTLRFSSGERGTARVVALALDQDIAVLRVSPPRTAQPALPLGNVAHVRVGEEVLAIGSPLGLQSTVTRGIVSAVRRAGPVTLVQTDAAINPGNSGGPLLNRFGRVIAIATMKAGKAESLGFGVAIDHARALLETGSATVAATAGATPAGQMVPAGSDTSTGDDLRAAGEAEYERLVAAIARSADTYDEQWARFSRECLSARAQPAGDRGWFALWEPTFADGAVSPACARFFRDFKEAAGAVRDRMVQADEAARRAGVYPGTRREIRARYRLAWDGWDR